MSIEPRGFRGTLRNQLGGHAGHPVLCGRITTKIIEIEGINTNGSAYGFGIVGTY
jgi:hypothetical protein